MKRRLTILSLFCLVLAHPVSAQIVHGDDVVINGAGANDQLCIGDNCADDEVFSNNHIKLRLKDDEVAMEFVDINSRDWVLEANVGAPNFVVQDLGTGNIPFKINSEGISNTLVVAANNSVGLGTELPLRNFHIVDSSFASIRLETLGLSPKTWDILSAFDAFYIQESGLTGNPVPFLIDSGAPHAAFWIEEDGNIGMGTTDAQAPLEVSRDESFNFFRLTATQANVNQSVDIVFTEGPLGTGQLRYNIVEGGGAQTPEMTLDADGNMVLTGTLTTAGPTCAGGCDRVFDADYSLMSIEDHAAAMFKENHLPSLAPIAPLAPVNLSERQGQIVNSLEHAHVYIAQQQALIEQMQARLDALEAQ